MKFKISTYTHSDSLEEVVQRVKSLDVRFFPGTSKAKAIEELNALARPIKVKDLRRLLKQGGFPDAWWKGHDWRPHCDFCEEPHDWLLVVQGVYCGNGFEGEEPIDVHICESCINTLRSEVFEYYSSTPGPEGDAP